MKTVTGNIFESGADVLVNPVNCVGIAGAGLAKKFAEKCPFNLWSYKAACNGFLKPGRVLATHHYDTVECDERIVMMRSMVFNEEKCLASWKFDGPKEQPKIINFPTKNHWKNKSEYAYIEAGLKAITRFDAKEPWFSGSKAFPALGCGLGGLDFDRVAEMIEKESKNWRSDNILLYKPQ